MKYYHGSPNTKLTELPAGSYISPDEELAYQFGRYYQDSRRTWDDNDLTEPYYFNGEPKFKNAPTGIPKVYQLTARDKDIDKLDNPYEHRLRKAMKVKSAFEIIKDALHTQRSQEPITLQKTRQRTAVIVKGNPQYIENNRHADKYYNTLADLMRSKGYAVTFDPGAPHTMPPNADIWLGHSRGADRFRFAPKEQKTISLGSSGGINHPLDTAMLPGQSPTVFHYLMTNKMKSELLRQLEK